MTDTPINTVSAAVGSAVNTSEKAAAAVVAAPVVKAESHLLNFTIGHPKTDLLIALVAAVAVIGGLVAVVKF
jgi:hypothetical protein